MNKLPKPKHKLGYPSSQLDEILVELKINIDDFSSAFGVNTCALDETTNETIYYPCDIERALYKLKHKLGKNWLWD